MKLFIVALALVLSACGSNDSSPAEPKSVFAAWTRADGIVYDLSTGSSATFTAVLTDGPTVMNCTVTATGDESSGVLSFNGCDIVPTFILDYNYSRVLGNASTLQLCEVPAPHTCYQFR